MFKMIRFIFLVIFLSGSAIIQADCQNPVEVSMVVEQYNGKNYYLHTVEAKQTIYAIAKAYQITPESVLIANPASRNGIRINQVLRIPVATNAVVEQPNQNNVENQPAILKDYDFIYHVAGENDRFSYIADIYLVSENNIRLANPSLSEPLNQGVYVRVPISSKDKKPLVAEDQFKRNDYDPFITPTKSKDQQGSSRMEVAKSSKPEEVQMVSSFELPKANAENKPNSNEPVANIDPNVIQHIVKPKETVYSISKSYNCKIEDLRNANPGLIDEIKIGQVLIVPTVPGKKQTVTETVLPPGKQSNTNKEPSDQAVSATQTENNAQIQFAETDSMITHTVKKGETLYSIARNNAVSIDELKKINKGLTEQLRVGQVILIPKKKISLSFIIHEVNKEQKTSQLADDYGISTERLQRSNPNLGRKVYIGQKIKIPISDNLRVTPVAPGTNATEKVAENNLNPQESEKKPAEIQHQIADPNHVYKVALLLPLYLEEVDSMGFTSNTNPDLFSSAKPFSFIQFYEGFMIAADSIAKTKGMKLEILVFDVDQNQTKLNRALADPKLMNSELIIGPFFGNAFEKVAQFAMTNKIPIVNPMSPRPEILRNNPFVIKAKPGDQFQYEQIAEVIAKVYPLSRVFICRANTSSYKEESQKLISVLSGKIPNEVAVPNAAILDVITRRSLLQHRESGDYISSIKVEGKTLYTNQLQQNSTDNTVFSNPISELIFRMDSIKGFRRNASLVRPNILITFADDNVFAMQFVNKLSQVADTFDIKLIGLPDWEKFDNLFIDNLMKMNSTFLLPSNINYTEQETLRFNLHFKQRFNLEPEQYAYEGFDIGYYFLEALMRYGDNLSAGLVDFEKDMLQTQFHFTRNNEQDGMENRYWNFVKYSDYQLLPINNVYFSDKSPQ